MTLRYLQDLYHVIIWASKTIGKIIDQLVLTEVSTPQFDQFKGWENGFINEQAKNRLYKYWNKRDQLFRRWSSKYWDVNVLYKSPYKS